MRPLARPSTKSIQEAMDEPIEPNADRVFCATTAPWAKDSYDWTDALPVIQANPPPFYVPAP
jgi:hypothetical protein